MKVCHMEAMKEIRILEEQKELLLRNEMERCTVSYKEGEKKVSTGYSFAQTREKVTEIDTRIRKIKSALARANCTVLLEGFDVTIGEGLVMLAQWSREHDRLSDLSYMRQITRRITPNGILEYTECLFDVEDITAKRDDLKRRISALQVAIDRANLMSLIEI